MEHSGLSLQSKPSSPIVFNQKPNILFREHWFALSVSFVLLLHCISLFNGVMEVDAALYASIAKRIAVTGDWINLFADGRQWLDKPHLPFWITAASFKIFGTNDFAYKFPAFLSLVAGTFYIYQLTSKIYNRETARIATVIFLTSLHLFLSCFDVRAEAYLVTFIIAAVYYMYKLYKQPGLKYVVPAALACAAAVGTKGIFVLTTVSSGFVLLWIYQKEWQQFLSIKWWLLLVLTLVFILPELYCLYMQFDLHPEKIVFGKTGVSGIRFFFWDSQFGRFFNNGPIKGSGDVFFYLHTFLWAFLPWSLVAYVAVIRFFLTLQPTQADQIIPIGTMMVSFIIFSLSKFQLPHYIVILFPFFAMVTANYLLNIQQQKSKNAWRITLAIEFIIVLGIVFYTGIITRFASLLAISVLLMVFAVLFFINWLLNKNDILQLLFTGMCTAAVIFLFLNLFFYPALLQYQGGEKAARWINKNRPGSSVILYKDHIYAYNAEWHLNVPLNRVNNDAELAAATAGFTKTAFIFSKLNDIRTLQQSHSNLHIFQTFQHFHVSQVTPAFLDYDTRKNVIDSVAIAGW